MIFKRLHRNAITINIFSADFYTNLSLYSVKFYHNVGVLCNIYILLRRISVKNISSDIVLFGKLF